MNSIMHIRLPLTRHYHQCAETFGMGRDTGKVKKTKQCQKQTMYTSDTFHKYIHRKATYEGTFPTMLTHTGPHASPVVHAPSVSRLTLSTDFLLETLSNVKWDLTAYTPAKLRHGDDSAHREQWGLTQLQHQESVVVCKPKSRDFWSRYLFMAFLRQVSKC